MIEVHFGKDKYHLQDAMINWCRENISEKGGWGHYSRNGVEDWGVDSAFGNTHFYFRDERYATMFTLVWA